jgi:hypothetical protein
MFAIYVAAQKLHAIFSCGVLHASRERGMRTHQIAVAIAIIGAVLLLACILFGWNVSLKEYVGVDRNLRDISLALWSFLLPAWFTLEEWWAPNDQVTLERFRKNQQHARYFWTVIGGAIAIIIGTAAPIAPSPGKATSALPESGTAKNTTNPAPQ